MTHPRTILDVFAPPEGLVGHSAALVAMTATEDLLEDAMQRFTGLRAAQRAQLGAVVGFLMLDPHATPARKQVLRPDRVPGLLELQPRAVPTASLLHAKLALLAFAATRTGEPVHLRLAVLTANFTYASIKQQLELVWTVDVPLGETADAKDRSDIAAAAAFVEKLLVQRFHRGPQERRAGALGLTSRLHRLLEVSAELAPARGRSRFIHSLSEPLFDQVEDRFRREVRAPRNLLLCGSGFFEEATARAKKPEILARLERLDVLTTRAQCVVLAEPHGSGALAAWVRGGATDGWEVRLADDAAGLGRRLHAKFIYVAYLRDGHVSRGCLYIGSGNLSKRGLLTHGDLATGNIECAVVAAVPERMSADDVHERLFWKADLPPIDPMEWDPGSAEDDPETSDLIEVPPILSAMIEGAPERVLRFIWRDDVDHAARVEVRWTGADRVALAMGQQTLALGEGAAPTALTVRDAATGAEWIVAVVDPNGRVCWQPLRAETYEDALATLLDFPIRPAEAIDDDEQGDEFGGDAVAVRAQTGLAEANDAKSYALHAGAQLLDRVAALQQALPAEMLDDWIDHLDRALHGFPVVLVDAWRVHGVDVLEHLRARDLMPEAFSEEQRERYRELLTRAAMHWGAA